jgi:hypothetical protein
MRTFDVTLNGFDGGTDKTDHLVKWVRAESRSILDQWLKLCGITDSVRDITDIGHHATAFDQGVDVKLSLVMPNPGEPCSVRNCGGFFQITEELFDAKNWVKESENCLT